LGILHGRPLWMTLAAIRDKVIRIIEGDAYARTT
jgi:hypothetical protein